MVPGQCSAYLVFFVIERDVVIDLVELFPRIFARCLLAYPVDQRETLEGCSLSRVRLRLMVFSPILLFRVLHLVRWP